MLFFKPFVLCAALAAATYLLITGFNRARKEREWVWVGIYIVGSLAIVHCYYTIAEALLQ